MSSQSSSLSRRAFLGAAGAAYVFVPKSVNGFTAAEMRAMSGDAGLEVGVSKWELDTPALCVDLDKLEANIAKMQAAVKRNGIATRPHAKTHKCAAIGKLQMAAGAIGLCAAKITEAEALLNAGLDRICMTTANPAGDGLQRGLR